MKPLLKITFHWFQMLVALVIYVSKFCLFWLCLFTVLGLVIFGINWGLDNMRGLTLTIGFLVIIVLVSLAFGNRGGNR